MPQNQEVHQQRRQLISEIIRAGNIATQAELVDGLRKRGFTATQSSISRDLSYLGVAKVAGAYVLPATYLNADLDPKLPTGGSSDIARWVRTVHAAGPYLLVVRTAVGAASQVAVLLDSMRWPEIVGTVAGDDTIFLATESKVAQSRVARRLFETSKQSEQP